MSEPIKKALMELGRMAVLAVIPILVLFLSGTELDWRALSLAVVIALLKVLDKFIHELGKEKENDTLTKGLTRF